jgi:hypothetical protein
MDELTYTLRGLCQRNRDGSHATQADRLRTLALVSRQLRAAGFTAMTPPGAVTSCRPGCRESSARRFARW